MEVRPNAGSLRAVAKSLIWPCLAMLPALVVMRGMFSTTQLYYYRDLSNYFWPIHLWFGRTVAGGDLPLWDPYVAFGQASISEAARMLLFPPLLLVRLLFPGPLGLNLSVGLPFPLAALGLYGLLRRRLTGPAAALGGALFSVSATLLSSASMLNVSWSMCLAPVVLWAADVASERATWRRFAWLAAAVGVQALAAEPATLLGTAAVAVFLAVSGGEGGARARVGRGAVVAAAVVCGGLLSSVQLVPLTEAVGRSLRATEGSNAPDPLHPARLIETVLPEVFGDPIAVPGQMDPWEPAVNFGTSYYLPSHYVGAGVLGLAALGLAVGSRRRTWPWAAVGAVGLVYSLGKFGFLYTITLEAFPFLSLIRYWEKFTFLPALALAVLAAEGFAGLVERRVTVREAWVGTAAVAGCVAVAAATWIGAPALVAAFHLAPRVVAPFRESVELTLPQLLAVSGIAVGAFFSFRAPQRTNRILGAFAVLLLFDLFVAAASLNPQVDVIAMSAPEWVHPADLPPGSRVYIGAHMSEMRPDSEPEPDRFQGWIKTKRDTPQAEGAARFVTQTAASPSAWGLRDSISGDFGQIWPREYHAFTRQFVHASLDERARALERVGVRTQLMIRDPGGEYRAGKMFNELAPATVYTSNRPFARAQVVPASRVEPDSARASHTLLVGSFDPAAVAVLDRDPAPAGSPGEPGEPAARIVVDRPNEVVVEAVAAEGSTLVLWDSYDPGWSAEVDGRPAEIARANGLFRGVRLAPGTHRVRMTFMPRSLIIGAAVSGIVGLLLFLLAAAELLRTRVRDRAANVGAPVPSPAPAPAD